MAKSRLRQINMPFPVKGLVESTSFSNQPPSTTAKCMNVCGYEPTTGRNRGGSRPGTAKYCSEQIEGMNPIQEITHVATLKDPGVLLLENTWFSTTSYVVGDVVSVGDILYECILDHSNQTPPNTTYWSVLGDDIGQGATILQEDGLTEIDLGGFQAGNIGQLRNQVIAISQGYVNRVDRNTKVRVETGQATPPIDPNVYTVFSEQFEFGLYFVDGKGYKYYDLGLDAIVDWEAAVAAHVTPAPTTGVQNDLLAAGLMPTDDATEMKKCTIMCVWNGRIVMSGLETDPTNWFMSAVDNPFDWDYTPATDNVRKAVAGTSADAGKAGDVVTALIPYTEDVLIIGGQHTIERLSGDPADGGRRDQVTNITGIARGKAWCQSPEGTVYFVGSRGGVYELAPQGGIPTRITAFAIDERLSDLDTDANVFRLVWDDRRIGVHVFVTLKAGGCTTHYFWCIRNKAWFPFEYHNSDHNPMTVHLLDGYSQRERAILIGSFDGYVRMLEIDAVDDDGEPIESYVYLGPFSNTTISEIQMLMGAQSFCSVRWSLIDGATLEQALSAMPAATGIFRSGQNWSEWPRRYLGSGYMRFDAVGSWQYEQMSLTLDEGSLNRQRINAR